MNEFGNAIADMLYSRMDDGEFLQRLQDSPAYAQAQQEYQDYLYEHEIADLHEQAGDLLE